MSFNNTFDQEVMAAVGAIEMPAQTRGNALSISGHGTMCNIC